MFLGIHKSVSALAIKASKASIYEGDSYKVLKSETEALTQSAAPQDEGNEFLEEHLFCSFLANFATFTLPQPEPKQPDIIKYVDCNQEDITSPLNDFLDESELAKTYPLKKPSDSEKPISAKISKRKSRLSKGSRHSRRLSKFEKVIKVIDPDIEEEGAPDSIPDFVVEDNPFLIIFSHLYDITGENKNIMQILKDSDISFDFLNGNKFEGKMSFKNNDGSGKYYWSEGSKYQGKFEQDYLNGIGCMEYSDGTRYEGFFTDGIRNGIGTQTETTFCENGGGSHGDTTFSGVWQNGLKSGKGTYKYSEVDWYDGDFLEGLYNGKGMRQYASGSKYLGQWKNGKQNGSGIMLFCNNDMYIGEWADGKMEGTGKYVWDTFLNNEFVFPMLNTYIGEWQEGMRHGVGSLILSSGAVISTRWEKNVKNGNGKIICVNGAIIEAKPLFSKDTIASMKNTRYVEENIFYEVDDKISKSEKYVNEMLSEINSEINDCLLIKPYKACSAPINIPSYFMNLDVHINKFFQLNDWYDRISWLEWCPWLESMPPGFTAEEQQTSDDDKNQDTLATNKHNHPGKNLNKKSRKSPKDKDGVKCIHYYKSKKMLTESFDSSCGKINDLFKELQNYTQFKINQDDSYDKNIEEYIKHIYIFEKKWLRNTIIKHMPLLHMIYIRYSNLCCKVKPTFNTGLLRLLLWKLLKDVGFEKTRCSIVEIDKMAVGKSDPFDYVPVSEMIHYLLILAWELYTKNNLVSPSVPGMLGGGFDKFIMEKVYPLNCEEEVYMPLFPNWESIPLEAVYKIFNSLGTNVTVKKFVRYITQDISREHDKHSVLLLPEPNEFFKHVLHGYNAIVPGGEIIYNMSSLPDLEYVKPEYRKPPKVIDPIDLKFFGTLSVETVLNIVIKCCPQILDDAGDIVNQHYEICFLEFLDIFTEFINTYLEYKLRFKIDKYDENKKRLLNKCLNDMLNISKSVVLSHRSEKPEEISAPLKEDKISSIYSNLKSLDVVQKITNKI